jgi:hypothetical protein
MPRISAEARAAAAFRAGAAPPPAPPNLSRDAATVWAEIVASKPVDWFDPGARILLECYCETSVHARAIAKRLDRWRRTGTLEEARSWEKRYALLIGSLVMLATKLRLTVQALIDRRSRAILERGNLEPPRAGRHDRLLGGEAVWGKKDKPN